MVSHPISHKFKEIGLPLLDYILSSLSRRLETGQSIITVHARTGNTERDGPGDNPVRGILIGYMGRDSIFIVPQEEQRLASERGCEVQSCWKVSLTGRTLTQVARWHTLNLPPEAPVWLHLLIITEGRGDSDIVVLPTTVVNRHLPALTAISDVSDALVDDVLDAIPPPYVRTLFSILSIDQILWSERCSRTDDACMLTEGGHVE